MPRETSQKILNITNGDGAVHVMKAAKIAGDFLPWRDILHEGPVPSDLNLDELSLIRAEYLSLNGYGGLEKITKDFQSRNKQLSAFIKYDKVILWFEHDLYDQLQLLQLLSFFNQASLEHVKLSIICHDQYLGRQSPHQLKEMQKFETTVTKDQLDLGQKAWAYFRDKSSKNWQNLLKSDTSSLPFLAGAIERMIEEYPHKKTGLSRTEQQTLTLLVEKALSFKDLFLTLQKSEEREFMGDSSLNRILKSFLSHSPALITLSSGDEIHLPYDNQQLISITPQGKEILSPNSPKFNPPMNRWVGGVKFT